MSSLMNHLSVVDGKSTAVQLNVTCGQIPDDKVTLGDNAAAVK